MLGFLGFLGFLPQFLDFPEGLRVPSFFLFFGFFGFYYEGKMSDTFIDERFQSNIYRAESIANNVSLSIIIMVAILTLSVIRLDPYNTLSILIATIGFAFGLSVFLQPYLLYQFENEE